MATGSNNLARFEDKLLSEHVLRYSILGIEPISS